MSELLPDDEADAAFISRVSPVLREPVTLNPSFDGRVMEAVRAEARRAAARGWWRRQRAVFFTPLTSVAAAAAFAIIVAAATVGVTRTSLPSAAGTDTVHVVRFIFVDDAATRVSMVGDFNSWDADATPLQRTGVAGVWSASVTLRPGRHEYAFVADGKRWTADPFLAPHDDEFGTASSVITVGPSGQ